MAQSERGTTGHSTVFRSPEQCNASRAVGACISDERTTSTLQRHNPTHTVCGENGHGLCGDTRVPIESIGFDITSHEWIEWNKTKPSGD
jgi:hypothetical protein